MRSTIALLVVAFAGCATVDRVSLGMSVAELACDWGQTRIAAVDDWQDRREANPILGEAPSVAHVNAYMIGAMALDITAYLALPKRWRWASALTVAGFEANTVQGNRMTTRGTCGL